MQLLDLPKTQATSHCAYREAGGGKKTKKPK